MANSLPVRAKPVCTSSAISRMPCSSHTLRSACISSGGVTLKPPSPCTGSMMMAATRLGSMSTLNSRSRALSESATLMACVALGNGTWNTSPGIGPNASL
ncbi:Uncharacterised protein [Bordetella pertussis]|nr:Uncharacterised protein [Bordetella pertussis]